MCEEANFCWALCWTNFCWANFCTAPWGIVKKTVRAHILKTVPSIAVSAVLSAIAISVVGRAFLFNSSGLLDKKAEHWSFSLLAKGHSVLRQTNWKILLFFVEWTNKPLLTSCEILHHFSQTLEKLSSLTVGLAHNILPSKRAPSFKVLGNGMCALSRPATDVSSSSSIVLEDEVKSAVDNSGKCGGGGLHAGPLKDVFTTDPIIHKKVVGGDNDHMLLPPNVHTAVPTSPFPVSVIHNRQHLRTIPKHWEQVILAGMFCTVVLVQWWIVTTLRYHSSVWGGTLRVEH